MRKRCVPNVMQESSQPDKLQISVQPLLFVAELVLKYLGRRLSDGRVKESGGVHYPKGMLESRMHRPWVNLVRPRQLANAAKTLECGLRNDLLLPRIQGDEAMDGAPNLVLSM